MADVLLCGHVNMIYTVVIAWLPSCNVVKVQYNAVVMSRLTWYGQSQAAGCSVIIILVSCIQSILLIIIINGADHSIDS